jgi:beta-galactosidase
MQKQSLNKDWRFYQGENPYQHGQNPDDSTWQVVDLPHDWSIEQERNAANPSGSAGGYFPMGRGWYRKTIEAPEEWRGKKVLVEFEGVYMNADVWVNEHFLGHHPYGYTSFVYDLTPYLKYGAQNVVRVLVENSGQLNSRWYSGSGIYRPVWLLVAEPVHVAHWGISITTSEVSNETATVHVCTKVENEGDVAHEVTVHIRIIAPEGAAAGAAAARTALAAGGQYEFAQDLQVSTPNLWSPDNPALYMLETEVIAGGKVVGTTTTNFGIRRLHFSAAHGFLLNGQPLKLKGGCVHHDNGVLGAASYPRSEERKVENLKASGFNAIRCAHNPPAPAFLDACDRLGMLVIDETFDCWRDGKNPHDYHVVFDDWWQRDADSMLYRDRNHPSIILWSIGNELMERGRPEGWAIAHMLADHVRSVDPTRPVTAAMCGPWGDQWQWPQSAGFFAALDVGGYNYQWRQYLTDHEQHPERMMIGTESFPLEAFDNWMSVLDNNYVLGDFVWTSLDYLGESGIGRVHFGGEKEQFLGQYPWHQAYCGDLDLCGFKRPQSYYRDVVWQTGSPLYIAVHYPVPEGQTLKITLWGWPDVGANWTWPGKEGQTFKVDVYSAFEKVELFLNDKSLGIQPTSKAERFMASFEVPYAPGELKAVGYSGDQPTASRTLKTSGAAAQVRLTADRPIIQADGNDLSYVTVEVLDAAGQVCPDADNVISFTVSGEGSLLAVGSGNPVNTESYRGAQHKAFRGRCLAVVKSNGKQGEIRLQAQADGLNGTEIVIQAR